MFGDGRNSGVTQLAAVAPHQSRPRVKKTAVAMAINCRVETRAVRENSRCAGGAFLPLPLLGMSLLRGGSDEARIDQFAEIDIRLENTGLLGGGFHFRNDLVEEVAGKLRLVIFR